MPTAYWTGQSSGLANWEQPYNNWSVVPYDWSSYSAVVSTSSQLYIYIHVGDWSIGSVTMAANDALELWGAKWVDNGVSTFAGGLYVGAGTAYFNAATTANGLYLTTDNPDGGGGIWGGGTAGGTLDIGLGATLTANGGELSAYLRGAGTLATTGTFVTGTTFDLGMGITWNNGGTTNITGTVYQEIHSSSEAVVVHNLASGSINFTTDDADFVDNAMAGTLDNDGLLAKTGGTGTSYISAFVSSTGTILASTGTLALDGGGALGGSIGGSNGGMVSITSTVATAGTLTVLDNATAASLTIGAGGTLASTATILAGGLMSICTAGDLWNGLGSVLDFTTDDGGISGSGAVTNTGTIAKSGGSGTSTLAASVNNAGLIDAASGTLRLAGTVTGNGTLRIDPGATLEIAAPTSSIGAQQSIVFNGAGGVLKLDQATTFTKPLSGLAAGVTIDMVGMSVASAVTSSTTLIITPSVGPALSYVSDSSIAADTPILSDDGAGGTFITLMPNGAYTLSSSADIITAGAADDTFYASAGWLNNGDQIDGGGGVNTLVLQGGGRFDLTAPTSLVNMQMVSAAEGQIATGSFANTQQIVYLRAGLDLTLSVTSGTQVAGDSSPESIQIYGAANNDVINLSTGLDRVVIGGTGEAVYGGSSTSQVMATAALAGALVVGAAPASPTSLEVTTGGTAALNAGDTNLVVKLDYATNLTLGDMSFVSAIGRLAGNTEIAGAPGQTLGGLAGGDTLTGYSGFGDSFIGTTVGLNNDIIGNFGGNDTVDITNMNFAALKPLVYTPGAGQGVLTVTDGNHTDNITFTGSYALTNFTAAFDTKAGTAITWHS